MFERGGRSEIVTVIFAAARELHDMLDVVNDRHSHSLAAAIRLSKIEGHISNGLEQKLRRLARAADALRHTTVFAVKQLLCEVESAFNGSIDTEQHGCDDEALFGGTDGGSSDDGNIAKHALGLAELAVRGLDLVLTADIREMEIPAGVVSHRLDEEELGCGEAANYNNDGNDGVDGNIDTNGKSSDSETSRLDEEDPGRGEAASSDNDNDGNVGIFETNGKVNGFDSEDISADDCGNNDMGKGKGQGKGKFSMQEVLDFRFGELACPELHLAAEMLRIESRILHSRNGPRSAWGEWGWLRRRVDDVQWAVPSSAESLPALLLEYATLTEEIKKYAAGIRGIPDG